MAITLHKSMRGVGAPGSVHGHEQLNSSRKQIIQMLGNYYLINTFNRINDATHFFGFLKTILTFHFLID